MIESLASRERLQVLLEKLMEPYVLLSVVSGLYTVYVLATWFYNLFLHPLRHIPGPKVAAMTTLYEFWFDVIHDGRYFWEIGKMHDKYGPIVRVTPWEIHIRDTEFNSAIYQNGSQSNKINKDPYTVAGFSVPGSMISTVDHDLHRARRGYVNHWFSRRAINKMEPEIHERISKLCSRLEQARQTGEVVSANAAFAALSADVITQRFYGEHFDYLDVPDYKVALTKSFVSVTLMFHIGRFINCVIPLAKSMPIFLMQLIAPRIAALLIMQKEMKGRILANLEEQSKRESKSIIVASILNPEIPAPERAIDRLLDEGTTIILAGTETVARAMALALFHMYDNKTFLKKIREDLSTLPARPGDAYTTMELEALPYLNAFIHEALRLSYGPFARLPRISVNHPLVYKHEGKEYIIPPGTPVSQFAYFVHHDETIFPNSYTFEPERWIRASQEGFPLQKYLLSFSKGSRMCIGIQMAWTELYLALARVALNFDMEIHETTLEVIKVYRCRIVGFPRQGKKAVNPANPRGEVLARVTGRTSRTTVE